MFDAIAPTYERVNTLFSGGRDARWRRKAVRFAAISPDDAVLDVACGTGDFARAAAATGARVFGCDFSHQMLLLATGRGPRPIHFCEADALQLPVADTAVTAVTCAFGARNFQDLDAGFREMYRVLKPGGRALILEFTRPANRFLRWVYELYASRLMPVLAGWISGDRVGAYRYLPRSVVSFADATEMCQRLRAAGFSSVRNKPLTFGIVTVYLAQKEGHREPARRRIDSGPARQ